MKKTEEEKRRELEIEIQSVSSGRELEKIAKINKRAIKKHHNKED